MFGDSFIFAVFLAHAQDTSLLKAKELVDVPYPFANRVAPPSSSPLFESYITSLHSHTFRSSVQYAVAFERKISSIFHDVLNVCLKAIEKVNNQVCFYFCRIYYFIFIFFF
jgi:hypothetical protein